MAERCESRPDVPAAGATPLWEALAPARRPGRVVSVLNVAVPGVKRVRAQVAPYAEAWRERAREALASPGRRWVVLGDSMAQSVGASRYDAGWVGQVDQRLRADGVRLNVVNLSVTGARAADVLERQVPAMAALPPGDPDAGPDLVTLMAGSNDLFGGRAPRALLPAVMADLARVLPDGAVVTALPQPQEAAQRANRPLDRAAAEGRFHLVDLRTSGPRSWRGKLASDFFHPNDAGYAAIADAVEPVVRAALAALPD